MKTVGILRSFALTFFTIVVALLFLMRASSASAAVKKTAVVPLTAGGNCLQDEFTLSGATQKLSCTANDVSVAKVTNVRDLSGNKLTSCIAGSTFNFIADFEIVTTSKSSRSNIGLYFATAGGQATALTGSCSDNIIPPSHTCPGSTVTCGSDNYDELDPAPDNCGDSSSTDLSATFGAGAQDVTIEVDNFSCTAPAGTTQLVLPNCTSWQVPGSTIQCVSPSSNYPYEIAAVPGSPSKCNCATIPLPITVQSPTASVTKNCSTVSGGVGTLPTPACTLTPEGGTVTYTVDVTNTSNFGNIIVDQICDSAYGTVFRAGTFTGPPCAAGSTGSGITGTTCSALSIAQGTDQSCTFTASQPENVTVTDTVQVTGHGASAGTFGPTTSNSATVTSGEAPSTATITKSLISTTAGCATVRYGVDVKNTSTADEVLSLSALSDSAYGSITSLQGSVLGTTCDVANGVGTLAGTGNGAGALPKTLAVGSDYICQFDAQFCGTLTPITLPNGTTCSGIQHSNQVTGTLMGDDSPPEVVSQSANTLTVYECSSAFSSSAP